jgi:ComF family protein
MNIVKRYFNDLLNFLFPELCVICSRTLVAQEQEICLHCINDLPLTYFHLDNENPISKIFWGRKDVVMATAMYHYGKGNKIQKYLHALKYQNHPYLGKKAGLVYGNVLKNNLEISQCDFIIAVPLHDLKLKVRGYNQSQVFAEGLSESLEIPILNNVLNRIKNTATQTKKTKEERAKNVKGVFEIKNSDALKGKNIILVDDVVTTGATLEECCAELNKIEGLKIYILCIAAG